MKNYQLIPNASKRLKPKHEWASYTIIHSHPPEEFKSILRLETLASLSPKSVFTKWVFKPGNWDNKMGGYVSSLETEVLS